MIITIKLKKNHPIERKRNMCRHKSSEHSTHRVDNGAMRSAYVYVRVDQNMEEGKEKRKTASIL